MMCPNCPCSECVKVRAGEVGKRIGERIGRAYNDAVSEIVLRAAERQEMWGQFHKVWGLARERTYQINEWNELQVMVQNLLREKK